MSSYSLYIDFLGLDQDIINTLRTLYVAKFDIENIEIILIIYGVYVFISSILLSIRYKSIQKLSQIKDIIILSFLQEKLDIKVYIWSEYLNRN